MTNETKVEQVRSTIKQLIEAGTSGDLGALDYIYHDRMKTYMIDTDGNLLQSDKSGFMSMLKEMIEHHNGSSNKWAKFEVVEADGDNGHVLITRKVNLGGLHRILILSIDLIRENNHWQVIREVIFSRPNLEPTPV